MEASESARPIEGLTRGSGRRLGASHRQKALTSPRVLRGSGGQSAAPLKESKGMWRFVLAPLAAVLYGLYLRLLLVKMPQLEELVRRKFF